MRARSKKARARALSIRAIGESVRATDNAFALPNNDDEPEQQIGGILFYSESI